MTTDRDPQADAQPDPQPKPAKDKDEALPDDSAPPFHELLLTKDDLPPQSPVDDDEALRPIAGP